MKLIGPESRNRGLVAHVIGRSGRRWLLSVSFLCASAFSSSAFAQTCPLCYEQASQSGARTVHAINLGILTLLIPTLLMFVGVLVFAVRRANSHQ